MLKNTSGQKWRVFAFTRSTNEPLTGDAANITAKISIDYGSRTALADTNPTEAEDGYYYFDLSAAETNANIVELFPESSTSGVQVLGVPARELPTVAGSSGGSGSGGGNSGGSLDQNHIGSDADLVGYMSSYGIRTWTNHTETDDPGQPLANTNADTTENALVMSQCKLYGSSFIASKLSKRYDYSTLTSSPMMVEVWCVIVLRTLCFRRGNPPPASLEFRYQELTQKDGLLDQIAKGTFPLTDGNGDPLRPKNSNAPGWSNLHVDRWYPESKVRVITGNSDMTTSRLPRKTDRFPESFG